jgi:hypothetical protein
MLLMYEPKIEIPSAQPGSDPPAVMNRSLDSLRRKNAHPSASIATL